MKEATLAVQAKIDFQKSSETNRNQAIKSVAAALLKYSDRILKANAIDLKNAQAIGVSSALLDRLTIDRAGIEALHRSALEISDQPNVVGETTDSTTRPDGLIIQKQRIPLGVIGMIFESRPNVVVDCSCLAIKSGNCIILKGGKEAAETNRQLCQIVQESIQEFIPKNVVQLIDTRDDVAALLNQVGLVDVIIPRGGENLIRFVCENSKIPVIAHFKGLCHLFIDESAELISAEAIALNSKTQRPGVCNAIETLLLHKNLPHEFVVALFKSFSEHQTEIRGCEKTFAAHSSISVAQPSDWETEYLANVISVKTVNDIDEAISHIQKYGSHHSEAIVSESLENIQAFMAQIDASSIMINASTRFNDGAQYGLGAELGISTTKLHAYGPMGAKEMTTERFIVTGQGHIRE